MSDNKSTDIDGTVHAILEKQEFASGFVKQVMVIKTEGEYPQHIPIEFLKDKTDMLEGLKVGDQVTAAINIRGNEYNGKYYANINAWRLSIHGRSTTPRTEQAVSQQTADANSDRGNDVSGGADDDSIPFSPMPVLFG